MFKLLIILFVVAYLVQKVGMLFFRAGAASQQRYQQPPKGKVHVDSAPPREKKKGTIKGGDYVDFEEVK